MNYILLHWSYGHGSVPAIINQMKEPCNALAKVGNGTWRQFSKASGEWQTIPFSKVQDILNGEDVVINWGNHIFGELALFDLNVPHAVALASNKRMSRRILQNAGVAVPKTWFWEGTEDYDFPCIARPSYHHAGKHFHILNNFADRDALLEKYDLSDWYFSLVFPKTHEYRLHVAHGKILAMYEKPLIPGEIRGNFSVNHESWRVLKWSEYNAQISRESIAAVEELGLDYGAVDVMYDAKNEAVAIAEVNTSPQTTWPYLAGKYAAYFDWAIRHNFPAHFEPEGTSVFYNNILRS
jgi:hypothetical protein